MTPWIRDLLLRDTRGVVTVEYIIIVGTVGLALVFALVFVGPELVDNYEFTRSIVAAPIP